MPDALDALRSECELVSKALFDVSDEDFGRPTRCPAWNVKELLAHMYRDVDRTNAALSEPAPGAPDTTAVSYWRSYDPATDAPAIADRARDLAARFGSGMDLLAAWEEMWRRACDHASEEDRSRPVKTWGPVLTLDDFLRTRVLEITVHSLDLADALARPPWPTGRGVAITRDILTGLLGSDPPSELGWDDVRFLETGTGRASVTGEEREILGPLADRFPLLG